MNHRGVLKLAAVLAVMRSAVELKQTKLMVYTDNDWIVQLRQEARGDERLDNIFQLRRRFVRLSLRSLLRQHNHSAHALAKQVIK